MSTNALVVVPDGDGWSGTYVHWDGMSLHRHLLPIIKRDGLGLALQTLFSQEWSALQATMPSPEEIEAAEADEDATYGTAAYYKRYEDMYPSERIVPGYGIFLYNPDGVHISKPKQYTGYPEYLYKLLPDGILCYDFDDEDNPKLLKSIKYDDVDPDLEDLEHAE